MKSAALLPQLIRSLRGRKTQRQLSQRLGYSSNQVHRWESGQVQISWNEFFRLASDCSVDLGKILRSVYSIDWDVSLSHLFFSNFGSKLDQASLLGGLEISRYQYYRYRRDESDAPAYLIFQLIYLSGTQFYFFLDQILKGKEYGSLFPIVELHRKESELGYQYPQMFAILSAISLPMYQNSKGLHEEWLAKKVGIDADLFSTIIDHMKKINLIVQDGKKYKLLKDKSAPEYSREGVKKILLHWNDVVREKILTQYPVEHNFTGYQEFSVSAEGLKKIQTRYREFYSDIASIVSTDDVESRVSVYVMTVNIVRLGKD